jgi:hypothetical protein
MAAIPRRNMIALQMQGDVFKRHRISIDVQSAHCIRIVAVILSLLQLALKKLGKV